MTLENLTLPFCHTTIIYTVAVCIGAYWEMNK